MSHVDMTNTKGCRDKEVFAMNLLGTLDTAYRVIWGYRVIQQICWDSQIQNSILLVRTWHPHHQHQGPKNVGNFRLGPLGN